MDGKWGKLKLFLYTTYFTHVLHDINLSTNGYTRHVGGIYCWLCAELYSSRNTRPAITYYVGSAI